MTDLENKIKEYADAYYSGEEQISDKEYDNLIAQLRAEQPDSSLLDTVVGEENMQGFKLVKHTLITGTLKKCRNEEEFKKWFALKGRKTYSVQYKCDGSGIELKYINGKFTQAVSRYNGFEGFDLTENVSKINGVCLNIDKAFTGSIRGEIVMLHDIFKKYFSDAKNCRNAAAGIIKRLDGTGCDKLNFIAYDVLDEDGIIDLSESSKKSFLAKNDFGVPCSITTNNIDDILSFRKKTFLERGSIPYDIDGIVIKQEKCDKKDLQKRTPSDNVAIKFELAESISVLRKITWQLQGSFFSPVGEIDPVEVDGAIITKVSLGNIDIMKKKNVEIGKSCVITRRGEVIPYLERMC